MSSNPGYAYRHVVPATAADAALVEYLAQRFPHSSSEQWRQRAAAGELTLDGLPASADQRLRAGSLLIWNRPGWIELDAPLAYDVIYCDSQVLAVAKPSGLPTLPGGGFFEHTLLRQVQRDFPTAHPLHRLGRATSGITLFALDSATAATLAATWSGVRKTYRALAAGCAASDDYDIRTPIGPVAHPRLGTVHAANPAGKPAHSVARAVERRAESTLFEVELRTGRPHQIRIHLASIGYPLVGDPLYAPGGIPRAEHPGLPGDPGYALHAFRLEFTHPTTGEQLRLEASPPNELRWAGDEREEPQG